MSHPKEGEEAMFYDDTVTPSEYLATQLPSEIMPEKKLMLAVLTDALDILNRSAPDGEHKDKLQRELDEVMTWMSISVDCGLFSFVGICGCLDFNAEYLWKGLRRLICGREDLGA